ncbi:SpoIIE family protein phosphatase [Amycolatopsis thermophila]|uniref:Serine phosphatase RsbU (Regulator of sigma subunit)/PAS domain-containing protein n=1 Tax=Amycolatopsis thermophila TaxID=206084 RepID=A0ABU0EP52_9PSEU|nr:SpoIIE family protein phosphatase [Amycolatopsis thermophila]MDQ0377073.1 serine phosphatase RsbU (regulator of sigma subunit)/PAS domain-containing protein [Amycolatopsis thermophila]
MPAQHPPQTSGLDPRVARLAAVVERQQQEIERLRAERDGGLLVPVAEGILVERLGYSPAEAAAHLTELAGKTGVTVPELAADLIGGAVRPPRSFPARSDEMPDFARLPGRDAEDAALLEEVRRTAGAAAVALWQVQPDGALGLAGHTGLDLLEASRWRHLPVLMDCLPQRAARERRPHWVPDAETTPGLPLLADDLGGARAVVPVTTSRSIAGVVEFVWPAPLPGFPPERRRQLTALAALCGREIVLSAQPAGTLPSVVGLLDAGLFARPRTDESGHVVDFEIAQVGEDFEDPGGRSPRELVGRGMTRVYPLLCAYGLGERAVEVLTSGASRQLGPIPMVTRRGDAATPAMVDVRITRFLDGVRIGLTIGHDEHRLAQLLHNLQHIGRLGSWEHSVLTGEMTWTEQTFELFGLPPSAGPVSWDELCTYVHPDDLPIVRAFQNALTTQEAATVFRLIRPDGTLRQIRAHGEPVTSETGELVAVRGIYQDLSAQYQSQVALTATRDRLADSEHEARQQNRIARELQQAILPSSRPVDMNGLCVAVRYRPAAQEHKVGGDWYDATVLPDGRILLVIGDVAGHGIEAATGMVALRNALRGLAVTGAGPGQLLEWLNTTTFTVNRGVTGTALCGLYEPADRTLTWARAGHLPPMLVRDGVAEQLPLPRGILLGARAGVRFEESVLRLRPRDTLVLFTDGLIERRGVLLDDSLDRLAAAACRSGTDVEGISDKLLAEATSDTEDDSCLIVIRVPDPVTSA